MRQLRRIVGGSRWGGEAAGPGKSGVRRVLPRVPGGCAVARVTVIVRARLRRAPLFGGDVIVIG